VLVVREERKLEFRGEVETAQDILQQVRSICVDFSFFFFFASVDVIAS
jgi:hypothetical protein